MGGRFLHREVGRQVINRLYIFTFAKNSFSGKEHEQWDQKNRQMSIKVAQKWMIKVENLKISTPLQKLLKNVGESGKLIVAKGLKKLPKVQ